MLKYELKIALRKLFKSKLYSSLNIVGLAIGLAACLIIATIVLNDLSYDKQWKNASQLYKLIGFQHVNHATEETQYVHAALGPELKRNFPEVKAFCRMEPKQTKIKFDMSKQAVDIRSLQAESTIWDMLDLTIVEGDPKQIKEGIDNVVITQQIKDEFYRNDDPVGKTIYEIRQNDTAKYVITGIIKNIPGNTHLRAQIIVMRSFLKQPGYNKVAGIIGAAFMPQYVLLNPNTDATALQRKIDAWYKAHKGEGLADNSYFLQRMQDVYLRSNYHDPEGIHASIDTVYIFSWVAVLILLVACINYVNLSTARAIDRMREAAVSRVVGAEAGHIMSRFLLEAMLFFVIAFVIAAGIYAISLRFAQQYLGNVLPVTLFNSLTLFGITVFTLLFICVITGVYPAYMLTKIKPVYALKGSVSKNPGMGIFKKGLIVTQFSIALVVLIASITINLQFNFLRNADPGYNKNNLLQIGLINWGETGNDFKKGLLRIPGVESASRTTWYPGYGAGLMGFEMKDPGNPKDMLHVSFIDGDIDLPATLNLHLKAGRFFDPKRTSDAAVDSTRYTRVLLSNTYVDALKDEAQLERPVPDFMHIPIGIIKDFHSENFLTREKPFIITAYADLKMAAMLIRITPGSDNARIITALQALWKRYYPGKTLTYNWADDLLAAEYGKENKLSNIFNLFTGLAIFLACLGLFGLVTFTLERRMKEIGIRKVLGASVCSISALISKDFIKLLAIAMLLASPVAWYFLNSWLQAYPYRVDVYWWIFPIATVLMLVITLATLSFKTIKAALTNPVKSLRSE